jgi:large subunit ribosomal protein L9
MAHTEVILITNIPTLGAEADIVKVRRGYARNFLLPQGKALEITSGSLRRINHLKAKRAEREAREVTAAEELASKINKLALTFTLDAGVSGKAFGSVTAKDIHDRIVADLKLEDLPKHAVDLDKAIKESGSHTVGVKLHPDVTANLKIEVTVNVPAPTPELTAEAAAKKSRRRVTNEA